MMNVASQLFTMVVMKLNIINLNIKCDSKVKTKPKQTVSEKYFQHASVTGTGENVHSKIVHMKADFTVERHTNGLQARLEQTSWNVTVTFLGRSTNKHI
mgnify:CR=1 FL=1